MAEQRRSGGKGIPHHPLVEALASDPNQPPEQATKLFGYPGPAANAKSTRLWLNLDLSSYVEVANDAIVHSQTLDNDQGTILWVEPGTTVTHSTTQSQEVQAEFLGGSIAEQNLAAAPAGVEWGSPMGGFTGETRAFPCAPRPLSIDWGTCNSRLGPCPADSRIPCPPESVQLPCGSWICPPPETFRPPCPQDSPFCPESVFALCPPKSIGIACTFEPRLCDPQAISAFPPCERQITDWETPVVNPATPVLRAAAAVGPFRPARFR